MQQRHLSDDKRYNILSVVPTKCDEKIDKKTEAQLDISALIKGVFTPRYKTNTIFKVQATFRWAT